jgi:hypothetical protein
VRGNVKKEKPFLLNAEKRIGEIKGAAGVFTPEFWVGV